MLQAIFSGDCFSRINSPIQKFYYSRNILIMGALFLLVNSSFAANRYWVGNSAGNWNDNSNWSNSSGGSPGSSAPGSGDVAIFDGASDRNCYINTNITVTGVIIKAGYDGNVRISKKVTFTINSTGFSQSGGVFSGGQGTVDINGDFVLIGGVFDYSGTLDVSMDEPPEEPNPNLADINMSFESSDEPHETMPYREPDPNGSGNGCMSGKTWNPYYKYNVCVSPTCPITDFAIERSNSYARVGSYSARFYLKPTPLSDWPSGEATHRAELSPHHNSPVERYPLEGEERWYGISYYFPDNFVFAPESIANDIRFIISQWQHGSAGSPIIALEVIGDEIVLQKKSGVSTDPDGYAPVPVATIQKGQWMDFVLRVKWSKNNGKVQVWVDNDLSYDQSMQTIYNNLSNGGGFKIGLYYWRWKEMQSVQNSLNAGINYREIFIDEVREYLGTDGYSIVAPGGI